MCVKTTGFELVRDDFERETPACEYTVITHEGPVNPSIHDSYTTLEAWIKSKGYIEKPSAHVIEYYDRRYDRVDKR